MGADFWIVLQWWGTLFLIGSVAFPLTKLFFRHWYDRGYLFAKAVGIALVTFVVYILGVTHIASFTGITIFWSMMGVFILGIAIVYKEGQSRLTGSRQIKKMQLGSISTHRIKQLCLVCAEECFFFIALLFWAWVKGHESSIHGLEKFMDYGFTQSIINSAWFPAVDIWYSGLPINYYYFGHTVMAVLTKLSGIDLRYTFNLMLASLFAFTLTMSFSIGYELIRQSSWVTKRKNFAAWIGGIVTAFLVTLAGNMQTLYAFTQGYTGEDVKPFWQLLWPLGDFVSRLPEGLEKYWYANATRFIPFTIHEFPSYSFVVSDVHGHVLSLPFTLLAIALLISLFYGVRKSISVLSLVFYGLLCGVLLMTNALDGPIYFGLFCILVVLQHSELRLYTKPWWKEKMVLIGPALGAVILASIPFMMHFKSFVSGVAVNCPPGFLANGKIGILLFEEVEKCQSSPFWMMYLLWGFFWFCGIALILQKMNSMRLKKKNMPLRSYIYSLWSNGFTHIDRVLVVFFFFSILLLIFPEFFYFKDIYPAHFRSNTMFKLGYQAFILFSVLSGYTIVSYLFHTGPGQRVHVYRKIFLLLLAPQLFLVSIYPIFSVRSYFDSLRTYKGLDGHMWFVEQYPDDYLALQWLKKNVHGSATQDLPVIVEADGDSYTDYARFSAYSGLPTIIGWPVHEWLWRGSYDVVAPRREDVRLIYESENKEETQDILDKHKVSYIIIGALEREKFQYLNQEKIAQMSTLVFTSGDTQIYQVGGNATLLDN